MDKQADGPVNPRPRSQWRWPFRFLALLFVLAGLSLSLWSSAFGYPTSFFLKTQAGDQPVHVNNPKFFWKFFPQKIAPEAIPFSIPTVKPKKAYRVFILGGSAARGTPNHSFSFGRILDVFLRHYFPGVQFELVNTSMEAINSHAALEIARDCVKLQPDLFVLYMGNNEVLELMKSAPGKEPVTPGRWEGMAMFLQNQMRQDAPAMDRVHQDFRKNLSEICRLAEKAGIPIAVCTVATNLKDCAPFASLNREDLAGSKEEWERIYREAVALESKGDFAGALELFVQAREIDNSYAELHYRLGRCYGSLEQYQKARESFVLARDYDVLRFRADTRINEDIHAAVDGREEHGAYLVNVDKIVSEASPHATPGAEIFYDHTHLKFEGNFLIAQGVFHRLEKLLPEWLGKKAAENVRTLTREKCAIRLGYTDWEIYSGVAKVLSESITKAPSVRQLNHPEQVAVLKEQQELLGKSFAAKTSKETMDQQYQQAIRHRKEDVWIRRNYASFLESFGRDFNSSGKHRRFVADALQHDPDSLAELSRTLRNTGKIGDAKKFLEKALQMRPGNSDFLVQKAILLTELEEKDEAIKVFQRAIELDPTGVEARYNFAMALDSKWGQKEEAISELLKIIRVAPKDLGARMFLGSLYSRLGRFSEALPQYNASIRIQPNYAQGYYGLGLTHTALGNTASALRSLSRLSKIDMRLAQQLSKRVLAENPQLLKNRKKSAKP
jgi:tetratricopeptide (TPR) repeat protein